MSVIVVILFCMHVLVAVVIVVVVVVVRTLLLSIEHGDLAAPDKEVGFGEYEEDARGEQSTGCKGRDAESNEFAGTVAVTGVGGGGFLPATDLAAEYRGNEEDDTGQGCDVDEKGGQDDLLPGLTTRGVGAGVHGTGRELVLLVFVVIVAVFVLVVIVMLVILVLVMLVVVAMIILVILVLVAMIILVLVAVLVFIFMAMLVLVFVAMLVLIFVAVLVFCKLYIKMQSKEKLEHKQK